MILLAIAALALGTTPLSQRERCTPPDISTSRACIEREGQCVDIHIDGRATLALTDEMIGQRVNAIETLFDVCWQVTQPVSTRLRIRAAGGGLFPTYLGPVNRIDAQIFHLDDFDPATDSRLEHVAGIHPEPDGAPNGTWQLKSERPLKAGEYVLVVHVFGDRWNRQGILLRLDPALPPTPPDHGTK